MKQFLKILLRVVLILVLIIVLLGVGLAIFFPTEKVKEIIVAEAKKQVNRDIMVQRLKFNLFKGIIIEDVRVSNRPSFSEGVFIKCKSFVFKYNLFKLLQRRLQIDALVLENPEIFIERYKKGKSVVYNFSDLIPEKGYEPKGYEPKVEVEKGYEPGAEKVEKPEEEGEREEKKKEGEDIIPKVSRKELPLDVRIKELGLKGAKVTVVDTATLGLKELYELSNIHFLLSNIGIKENRNMKLSAGFGLSAKEWKYKKRTEKEINLRTKVSGSFKLFDRKDELNPYGLLKLELKDGKFTGLQVYDKLRSEAKKVTDDVSHYQEELSKNYKKTEKQINKYAKSVGDVAKKLSDTDLSFIQKSMDWGFLKKTLEFDSLKTTLRIKDKK